MKDEGVLDFKRGLVEMKVFVIVLGAGLLVLGGCQKQSPKDSKHADAQPVVLHDAMENVVAPQAQILWDVSNRATNDHGDPDPSRLTEADWTRMIDAGGKLKVQATGLANAKRLTVALPGEKLQGEQNPGASSATQVGRFIAADRQGFSNMAQALAGSADEFIAAAKARDAARLGRVADSLDQICESCHVQTWYPQQVAAPK